MYHPFCGAVTYLPGSLMTALCVAKLKHSTGADRHIDFIRIGMEMKKQMRQRTIITNNIQRSSKSECGESLRWISV